MDHQGLQTVQGHLRCKELQHRVEEDVLGESDTRLPRRWADNFYGERLFPSRVEDGVQARENARERRFSKVDCDGSPARRVAQREAGEVCRRHGGLKLMMLPAVECADGLFSL